MFESELPNRSHLIYSMKALDFGNTNDLYYWGCHTPFSEDEEVSLPTMYKRTKQYVNHTFNSVVLGHDFAFLMVEAETNIDELLLHRYSNSKSFPELPTSYSMTNGKIVQVAVGREHAIMVRSSEDGDDVVSIGRNHHGQLGSGNRELVDKDSWTTIPHFQGQSNVKVFAGGGYDDTDDIQGVCFAIHTDKTVYAWGSNHAGQLGLGDTNDRTQPTLVNLTQVKKICIGNNHTIVLLDDRTVRSFGDNAYGQLGCGVAMQNHIHCNDGPFILDVHDISTFANTCIAVRIDGRVFVWGQDIAPTPKAVPELNGKHVSTVACTRASFYALTDFGELFVWGSNDHSQLGIIGHTNQSPIQLSLHNHFISDITCNNEHVVALVKHQYTEIKKKTCTTM